ncbi:MAG: hypothetical protein SPD11_13565 [Sphaerochaetaceae bacterium]|nr:hypothetical protein [Sphaerochaetaceae bacterium]
MDEIDALISGMVITPDSNQKAIAMAMGCNDYGPPVRNAVLDDIAAAPGRLGLS